MAVSVPGDAHNCEEPFNSTGKPSATCEWNRSLRDPDAHPSRHRTRPTIVDAYA